MEAAAPERLTFGSKEFALLVSYPTMRAFVSLTEQDSVKFDPAVTKAVELHKQYWSTKKRAHDSDGYLALGPLAMACIAHDLHLSMTITSDYIPAPIVQGTWAKAGD